MTTSTLTAALPGAAPAGARQPVLLDWTSHGPAGAGSAGPPRPCVHCRHPAICRSPRGVVLHKVCAEAILEAEAGP